MSSSLPQTATNSQSLNGIISLSDGVVTIEDGVISGLTELELTDLQVSDTATIQNLVVNNQIDMTSGRILNLAEPTLAQDASTKNYTDTASVNTNYLKRDGSLAMLGAIDMNTSNKIINLANPVSGQDASTKNYTDTASVNTNYLKRDGSLAMLGAIDMNTSNKIINVASPTDNGDVVNKQFLDTNFLNKTNGNTTQTIASRLTLFNTTSGSSNPIINLQNSITGFNKGMYLQFFKNFNRLPDTEIGSIVFADKAVSSQATSRAVQLTASIDSVSNPLLNITFDSGDFNPLTINNTQTILRNNDFYLKNKTATQNLLYYTSSNDFWAMSKSLNMSTNNITNVNNLTINAQIDMTSGQIINLADPISNQDASTKYYTDNASVNTNYLKRDGSLAMTGGLNMNSNLISNLSDPVLSQQASTKNYTDNASVNTNYLKRDGSLAMTGGLNMNSNLISNLSDPVLSQQASTKNYTDNASVNTNYLKRDGSLVMLGAIDMNTTNKITNLANGSTSNDAVNKSQLDLKSDTIYLDGNFLNKTTTTAQIVNSNLDMNTMRIYNLSNPTTQTDAVNLSYLSTNYLNKTTTANQTIANKVLFTNTTTDIVSNPVITMVNAIGGDSNGNFLRFNKNVVENSNTQIGGLSACDKNIGNTIIRVADLIFSRGSNGEARMDLEMIDGNRNPLRITDGVFTSKNNSHYFLKQDGTNLLNYTTASDKFTMSKPLDIETTNHLSFYNSDLTAESGMKMYFDRSAGSLGRFYMDMRGSEIQIRTDPSSEPTSQRVKINNSETTINNNLICNGNVNFNGDVSVNSNNHLMLGGNPSTTGGMRLVYDAGFQTYGTSYIDSRATSLKIRLTTISDPTTDRIEINNFATTIKDNLIVDGNTTLGNFATGDTLTCNCQATFPNTSKLTFQSGSILSFDSGAEIHGFRVKLRSIGADHTISSGSDLIYDGILCTNMAGTNIIITMPARSYVWNNRKLLIKSQTGDVKIRQVTTGTNTTTRNNSTNDLDITQNYRVVTYLFDSDFGTNGKIWSLD
jgi:uncharacterized protein YunC (DUF1805 family)